MTSRQVAIGNSPIERQIRVAPGVRMFSLSVVRVGCVQVRTTRVPLRSPDRFSTGVGSRREGGCGAPGVAHPAAEKSRATPPQTNRRFRESIGELISVPDGASREKKGLVNANKSRGGGSLQLFIRENIFHRM